MLRAAVDHIDTAQYYGSGVVNDLIRDALWPYPDGLAIVSKVAVRPDGGGAVLRSGDPDRLRQDIQDNLRNLRSALSARGVTDVSSPPDAPKPDRRPAPGRPR